jgi:hypothetical protein
MKGRGECGSTAQARRRRAYDLGGASVHQQCLCPRCRYVKRKERYGRKARGGLQLSMPVDKYGCHPGVSGVEGGGCTAHYRDPRPLLAAPAVGTRRSAACTWHAPWRGESGSVSSVLLQVLSMFETLGWWRARRDSSGGFRSSFDDFTASDQRERRSLRSATP